MYIAKSVMHNSAFNLQVILVFPSEVSETLQDLKV